MGIEAVIFDCDGVLVDSEVLYIEIECRALARIGLAYERSAYMAQFTGLSDPDFLQALDRDSWQKLGVGLPERFAEDLDEETARAMQTDLQAIAGISELMRTLDIPTAVASSATVANLRKKLDLTGLTAFFEPHVYSTELVKSGKPAPDIFLMASERLGREPRHCLVVEDSVNGVLAGVSAGMRVWGFTGGGHADHALENRLLAAGAEMIIGSHKALGERLREG